MPGTESPYAEVGDFLTDEAAMLDEDRLGDWLAILTQDVFHWVRVRQNVNRRLGWGFDAAMRYLYKTYQETLRDNHRGGVCGRCQHTDYAK